MTRFHVHVAVEDLAQSIRFYSTLFGVEPTVRKPDYAKWMLEDPRVNFAISHRGGKLGVQHLGIQAEDDAELTDIFGRLERAERPVLEEKATTCCYAQSDKQWVSDPQGVAWETFLTHGESTVYGRSSAISRLEEVTAASAEASCCGPSPEALAPKTAAPKSTIKCGCGPSA
jgi:catechol 2,3-dioxygenase-like lactoylglutathione lyase family enzyme